ncbi:MAG: hypothetical protein JW885_11670 [Deltaproteobacteria bacterium]|nr:hypothetical protein [Candidatus Zymogenaceae bacterium]
MGTSKPFGGIPNGTPLVPSWIEEFDNISNEDEESEIVEDNDTSSITIPINNRFTNPRSYFTHFINSKGTKKYHLTNSIRQYVKHGLGGPKTAAKRMNVSNVTALELLQTLQNIRNTGTETTLQQLNLDYLIGQTHEAIIVGLIDFFAPPGGLIDEAIARQSLIDATIELIEQGFENLEELNESQLREYTINFIAKTIERRLIVDIALRIIELPRTLSDYKTIEEILHSHIRGCVDLAIKNVNILNMEFLDKKLKLIYENAFEILEIEEVQ